MKNKLIFVIVVLIMFFVVRSEGADEKIKDVFTAKAPHQIINVDKKFPVVLRKCISQEVGMSFACDPAWKLKRKGNEFTVLISDSPKVEMTIEESAQTIHFISELSEEAFTGIGRYEDGFHFEHLTRCGRETIKINGYLKGSPNARVSDFYLIDHLNLHSIKFTIDPKDAWEANKWLIKEIIDSVRFIKQDKQLRFAEDESEDTCEEMVK